MAERGELDPAHLRQRVVRGRRAQGEGDADASSKRAERVQTRSCPTSSRGDMMIVCRTAATTQTPRGSHVALEQNQSFYRHKQGHGKRYPAHPDGGTGEPQPDPDRQDRGHQEAEEDSITQSAMQSSGFQGILTSIRDRKRRPTMARSTCVSLSSSWGRLSTTVRLRTGDQRERGEGMGPKLFDAEVRASKTAPIHSGVSVERLQARDYVPATSRIGKTDCVFATATLES